MGKKEPNGEELSTTRTDPREVETTDKVVWCALQDGSFEAFDLASKTSIYHHKSSFTSGALSAIAYSEDDSLLATGSTSGLIEVYDIRALGSPVVSFKRNAASIEDMTFINCGQGGASLAIVTEDGLPFIAGVDADGLEVVAELVGGDCDGLRAIHAGGPESGDIWTAGDDGIVRKYQVATDVSVE